MPSLNDLSQVKTADLLVEKRVLGILDTEICRLQITACLPRLLQMDLEWLRGYLSNSEIDFINDIYVNYLRVTNNSDIVRTQMKKRNSYSSVKKPSLDSANELYNVAHHQMACVADLLCKNEELKELLIQNFELFLSENFIELVGYLKDLRNHMQERFSITASQEHVDTRRIKKFWTTHPNLEQQVADLRDYVEKKKNDLYSARLKKDDAVATITKQIPEVKATFSEKIAEKIQSSEVIMTKECVLGQERQEGLSTQAKIVTDQYQMLVTDHMAIEKKDRSKRSKLEIRLCSWLDKYDTDIGDRNAEFEQLTEDYNRELAEMTDLQALYDGQEGEYFFLYEEMQQELEEKIYMFLAVRSARKIQRYWRSYVKRKIEMKKFAKMEKKRKKAERAAAKALAKKMKLLAPPMQKETKKPKSKKKRKTKEEPKAALNEQMANFEEKFGGGILDEIQGGDFVKINEPVVL